MKFKVVISNELPFMVQLPNGDYKVKSNVNGIENDVTISLSNDLYRLHSAPFPNEKLGFYLDGEISELQEFVFSNKIPNYSFQKLKSYVTCFDQEEKDLTQGDFDTVTQADLKERLKTLILRQRLRTESIELEVLAGQELERISGDVDQLYQLKTNLLIHKKVNEVSNKLLYFYYDALNRFIRQYAYVRNDFFVEPLTIHSLEGSHYTQYVDDKVYEKIKWAGKLPSILPNQIWREDISEEDLNSLKNRLENNETIPPTISLIIVARNLAERGEYRSAVIESSAALEIAVEEKITQKMKEQGKTDPEISTYLSNTQTNFYQRCDYQLKAYTGLSFIQDNSILWGEIDSHRKNYRHKIAHSTVNPDEPKTEEIINDFETAIQYIASL